MSQTEGEYRVGVTFNPNNDPTVASIKQTTAELIDLITELGVDKRCTAIACSAFEDAAMWAIKSVTKPDREV